MIKRVSVTYYQRKPYSGHWSVEYIFKNLRECLKDRIESRLKIATYISDGFFKRVYILFEAIFYQSTVNHVTGDINYIVTFLKKSRTILTIHDCGLLKDPSKIKRKILYFFWFYIPSKRVKYITTVSQFTKNELLAYLPSLHPENVIVIPAAVSEKYKLSVKKFNKDKPSLLHIGTAPNKNLFRLIEAIHNLSCTLTIIGLLSNDQKKALKDFNIEYQALSNITEEQIINEYVKADILTFISTHEGFGMPIIEANRTGRAVITSNCTSMPEVATNAACLVNPYDINAIRAGIMQLIDNDHYRNELIQKGIVNAERFSNSLISDQYYNLYCKIANR